MPASLSPVYPSGFSTRDDTYSFTVNDLRGNAHALGTTHIVLSMPIIRVGLVPFMLPIAEAKAMAAAIEAAVTHAENVLPTGLGESTVTP
ncbi:hypothetical protein [Reyranella sp.]|uniref:hypothetical protein n=1 Tax=Reyranella sp. TaxID=1929291 RepID=UPI0040374219